MVFTKKPLAKGVVKKNDFFFRFLLTVFAPLEKGVVIFFGFFF
jgi:hypothetical protein